MPFTSADKLSAKFKKDLSEVISRLDSNIQAILRSTIVNGVADPTKVLHAQAEMVRALQASGYYELVAEHAAGYEVIAKEVGKTLTAAGLPKPKFTKDTAQTFANLATVDIQGLADLGDGAIKALNRTLYHNALTGQPFSVLVDMVADEAGKMANHAYTYANTANLQFSGEVVRITGEELGAEKWKVTGPNDEVTRQVCRNALADPVRTKEEWIAADYWGGSPGGYNCRHILEPVFE